MPNEIYFRPMLFMFVSSHRADIALIGLAVMGQNIIMNMNDHGFVVSYYQVFLTPTADAYYLRMK